MWPSSRDGGFVSSASVAGFPPPFCLYCSPTRSQHWSLGEYRSPPPSLSIPTLMGRPSGLLSLIPHLVSCCLEFLSLLQIPALCQPLDVTWSRAGRLPWLYLQKCKCNLILQTVPRNISLSQCFIHVFAVYTNLVSP